VICVGFEVFTAVVLKSIFFFAELFYDEAICSSETSGTTQRTTQCHIPEEDTLQNHRCENLKFYMCTYFSADYFIMFSVARLYSIEL
jgi:hypothetical protein